MMLLLASIANGQLRHCVTTQQVSLLSRPRFLELGGGGVKYITSPPAKKLEGSAPLAPPPVPAPLHASVSCCLICHLQLSAVVCYVNCSCLMSDTYVTCSCLMPFMSPAAACCCLICHLQLSDVLHICMSPAVV